MHNIGNSNGHLTHGTLHSSHPIQSNRIQKPRSVKPKPKAPSKARHGDGHIEINAEALEAFLQQYSTDFELDDNAAFDIDSNASQNSENHIPTKRVDDDEIEDDWDSLSADSVFGRSSERSRSSSPVLSPSSITAFDIIALIPPSALAPYIPPLETVLDFFNVYFRELPSAKLMFDQRSVVRKYRDSSLPNPILFGILAVAALFHAASSSPADQDRDEAAIKSIQDQGRIWAELASQMALTKSDTSSLTTVRTCEQVSLYWYATGERNRANVHADTSYQIYRTMALSHPHRKQVMNFNRAIWLHDSFSEYEKPYQETDRFHLLHPRSDSLTRETDLLPAEIALGLGLENSWNDCIPMEDYTCTSHAVSAVGLWREVNAFLRQSINNQTTVDSSLRRLEHRLRVFNDALPNIVRARNLTDFQLAGPAQNAMLSFALIHSANMINLHSTRIPALANKEQSRSGDSPKSNHIVMATARIAGELIHEHNLTFSRGRKIPPMVGYCVFTIGSVHAHMNEFRDGPGYSEPWIYGVSCLLLLEHMKTYWPILGRLCHNLRRRFSYSDPNMLTISTKLLWQLAGQRDLLKYPSTQYTTGFFSVPFSSTFVHEMLGLDAIDEESTRSTSAFNSREGSLGPYSNGSVSRTSQKSPSANDTTNMRTGPYKYAFKSHLLGTIPGAYR